MTFTHLHLHTGFSLLDSSSKINELVKKVKELGMEAVAITDHGVMYGAIEFYKECKKNGIKPIIGCEVYVSSSSRFDKTLEKNERRYNHLVLLAKDEKGLKNLMKLVSIGFIEGFYYKPRIDYEVLEKYSEGLIATSACLAGIVATNIRNGNYEEAKKRAEQLDEIFGRDNFYLELQDHGLNEQKYVNKNIIQISRETGIPLVATNDCHYINEEDAKAHDVLLCIQTQKKVEDRDRMRYEGGQYYVKSEEEMKELFSYIPEAIENTKKIAERCNVEIDFSKYHLPKYEIKDGMTSLEYLKMLCKEGLYKQYKNLTKSEEKDLLERLEYEIKVVSDMGFVDYFLIVWDYVNFAKENKIAVGPGRGSAAGSLVSYCLGITGVDPIKYNLLFERFLNPERLTMPDIDIDFCVQRRQEVMDYVTKKYGREKVAQIVTFGTMAAKMVIRDVGRALDLPYNYCDKIAKMIPNELKMTIDKALLLNPELKNIYEEDEEAKNLIDLSRKLEGLPRHTSIHAAGIVISKKEIDNYVPLSTNADAAITTQYTMETIEELGLLKMDLLGLRNLTVIEKALELINRDDIKIEDIYKINMDDEQVYEMIGQGRTEGVFQLESSGMKEFMKKLKPDNIEDIIAGISLYRPGPMDFIDNYIEGKKNSKKIVYDCKELEPILSSTYGCIVYQEQVMQIVRDLAGYTYGRSDLLRRAMSKKKSSVMKEERENFVYGNSNEGIDGCVKRGIDEKVANDIYDKMLDFANYAFNRSHAAAYAFITYQTAYLKYYYPKEYMAALLSSVINNTNKVAEYIETCKHMDIKILPPDVNKGQTGFAVEGDGIRYGLCAIKGFGEGISDVLVKERMERGEYKSLYNIIDRLYQRGLNKKGIESLIKAGALDCLDGTRREKMAVYEKVVDTVSYNKNNSIRGQINFFELQNVDTKLVEIEYPKLGEFEKDFLLAAEKEMLGIYLSGHPLEEYEEVLSAVTNVSSIDFAYDEDEKRVQVNSDEIYVVGGIVEKISVKLTRNNKRMAFINLEDRIGNIEIIVFPNNFERYRDVLEEGKRLLIIGRASLEEESSAKLIAENMYQFAVSNDELWIQLENIENYNRQKGDMERIKKIAESKNFDGGINAFLRDERKMKKLM